MTMLTLEETINEVFVELQQDQDYRQLDTVLHSSATILTGGNTVLAEEAVITPAKLGEWMAAEAAYQRGYNDGLNVEKEASKQKYAEVQSVGHYFVWTRNPLLVKQHDVEFRDYLSRLQPTLRQACELLEQGKAMKAVAQQLGFSDQRTLKGRLQKAFGDFMDRH